MNSVQIFRKILINKSYDDLLQIPQFDFGELMIYDHSHCDSNDLLSYNIRTPELIDQMFNEVSYKIITHVIEHGINLDQTDNGGDSLVHYACTNSNLHLLLALLARGVNVTSQAKQGSSPLHYACEWKDKIDPNQCDWNDPRFDDSVAIVQQLIANNADIECQNKYNERAIHYATRNPNPRILNQLIAAGADVECQAYRLNKPIHLACLVNNLNIIKILVSIGVDLECLNENQQRPIDIVYDLDDKSSIEQDIALDIIELLKEAMHKIK